MRSPKLYPISTDGIYKVVFNGVPDWVYEGDHEKKKTQYRVCQKESH